MEPTQIPEDLAGLSEEDLTQLGLEIKETVEGLAEDARTSDEALAQVEGLMSNFDKINEELSQRQAANADRALRLEAALERFAPAEDEVVPDAEDEEIEEAAVEATAEAPAEAAPAVEAAAEAVAPAAVAEAAVEAPEALAADAVEAIVAKAVEAAIEASKAEAAVEVAVEAAVEAPEELATEEAEVVEAAVTEVEELATEVEAIEAPAEEFTTEAEAEVAATDATEFTQEVTEVAANDDRSTVARLSDQRPEAVAPRSTVSGGATLAARGIGGNISEGQAIDVPALAKAIVDKRIAMGNVPSGTRDMVTVASSTLEFGDDLLGGGAQENFSTLRRIAADHSEFRTDRTEALVASGGVCAPLDPNYDFFRLAEAMDPVERALPTAGAPRGGIRFISPPDFRDASAGVRVTTEAEDAAGYVSQGGPTPDKPCVAVECPPIEECRVDAVSQCVTFGNLNYRVFPEQVEAFLQDLSVIFSETKEIFYLDAIDAASTPVTYTSPYGAARGIAYSLGVAAANYRRRHHMSDTATLQVLLPSWAIEFVKIDMINDHALGLNHWNVSDAQVTAWFAANNLDVVFYYDSATGAGQAFNDIQAPGAINQWPDTMVSYMFAPGTFVRLDAGTLDVGLVRDSALNGTNDLQLFSEQWIQVCMVGIESLRIEHTLCPNGTAPEPVTPMTCPGGVS